MSKTSGPSEFERFTIFFDRMGVQHHISDYEMPEVTREQCVVEEKSKKSGNTYGAYKPNPLHGKEPIETMQVTVGQSHFVFEKGTGKFFGVVGDECSSFWPRKEVILLQSTPHPEGDVNPFKELWDNAVETIHVTLGKISGSIEEAAVAKGFESIDELRSMLSSIGQLSADNLTLFKEWCHTDGTKKGLVKLIGEIGDRDE